MNALANAPQLLMPGLETGDYYTAHTRPRYGWIEGPDGRAVDTFAGPSANRYAVIFAQAASRGYQQAVRDVGEDREASMQPGYITQDAARALVEVCQQIDLEINDLPTQLRTRLCSALHMAGVV